MTGARPPCSRRGWSSCCCGSPARAPTSARWWSRGTAQAAADLAALAAATRLPAGEAAACARATTVAREMGVDGDRCEVDGLDVVVTVRVGVPFAGVARAAARAGPVDTL